jgi:uncharacterized protein (TIGR02266 family)
MTKPKATTAKPKRPAPRRTGGVLKAVSVRTPSAARPSVKVSRTKKAPAAVSSASKVSRFSDGANRRLSERSPMMVLEIKGKYYDKIFIGYAENISRSGLFFSAANPPAVGATFPVEFVLPDNRTMVQCTCRVVWQHRYETTGRPSIGVGVEFLDLDQAKRVLIDQWVKRRSSVPRPRTARTKN